jgi:FkbM family methyltransferase
MRKALGRLSQEYSVFAHIRSLFLSLFPGNFYFRSYSQWGEDSFVSQFIFDTNWTYIDVGSGHPVHGNDTFFLYNKGCTGILVDPVKSNAKLSKRFRPRDEFVEGLVSSNKIQTFFQFSKSSISTGDIKRATQLRNAGNTLILESQPEVFSLSSIFEKLPSSEKRVLLKIDVEGLELSVLQSLDFNRFWPDLILLEELETLPSEQTILRKFLKAKGYRLIISGYNSHLFQRKILVNDR